MMNNFMTAMAGKQPFALLPPHQTATATAIISQPASPISPIAKITSTASNAQLNHNLIEGNVPKRTQID